MLSVYQIERFFHARHFDPLLRGVVPIGIELPLPLQVRLSGQPAAVIALALKRVLELTYGPTALARELTAALLQQQNDDGSFGDAAADGQTTGDPLTTAAAIAALTALGREHASTPNPEAAVARERAIVALANHQADDGLFQYAADRTDEDRALTSAFILTLLGGDDDFRHAVRYADLLNWFDDHARRLDGHAELLWRFAQVDAAPGRSHELAAIAA